MDDDTRSPAEVPPGVHDAQRKIGIFSIRASEALVEAVGGLERGAPVRHIGRGPPRVGKTGDVPFPIGRRPIGRERDVDTSLDAADVRWARYEIVA